MDNDDWADGRDTDDDSGLLEPEDSLVDRGVADVLDEGYSPPERPLAIDGWGTTAREEFEGESLDGRLARELPEEAGPDGDDLGDATDTDGELLDDEVGDVRSGRLVIADRTDPSESADFFAVDVGIDGAAASAEEAAMHVVAEPSAPDLD